MTLCSHTLIFRKKEYNLDTDDDDAREALLLAGRKKHRSVIDYILQKDTSILKEVRPGKKVWKQAIAEGISIVFEV